MGSTKSKLGDSNALSATLKQHFPNNVADPNNDVVGWQLMHISTTQQWAAGVAAEAGFASRPMICNGQLNVDCSASFCISRALAERRIKLTSRGRRKSAMASMTEQFEYNHIPAHLSSIQNYHVRSVICCHGDRAIVLLIRNGGTRFQFGLIDVRHNFFLGIFGMTKLAHDETLPEDKVRGQISPSNQYCVIKVPRQPMQLGWCLRLYRLCAKKSIPQLARSREYHRYHLEELRQIAVPSVDCDITFNPKFGQSRLVITNLPSDGSRQNSILSLNNEAGVTGGQHQNALSVVALPHFRTLARNDRVFEMKNSLYPYLCSLSHTTDASALICLFVDNDQCSCAALRMRRIQPTPCYLYVLDPNTLTRLRCVPYYRYACALHTCPINVTPLVSRCASRLALVVNWAARPADDFVQVLRLPPVLSLKSICRTVLLQHFTADDIERRCVLPLSLKQFVRFVPQYD